MENEAGLYTEIEHHHAVINRSADGDWIFQLDNGCVLVVYNPCDWFDAAGASSPPPAGGLIDGVRVVGNRFVIEFRDGIRAEVDVSDEAYSGPEAMVLHRSGDAIVL